MLSLLADFNYVLYVMNCVEMEIRTSLMEPSGGQVELWILGANFSLLWLVPFSEVDEQ